MVRPAFSSNKNNKDLGHSSIALDKFFFKQKVLGPVVQSSLVVKLLTVLVSTIYNSQVFLLKKCIAKATHIFSAKQLAYMPYLMVKLLYIR